MRLCLRGSRCRGLSQGSPVIVDLVDGYSYDHLLDAQMETLASSCSG